MKFLRDDITGVVERFDNQSTDRITRMWGFVWNSVEGAVDACITNCVGNHVRYLLEKHK